MSLEKVTEVRELIEQAQETMPCAKLPENVERALYRASQDLRAAARQVENAEFALCQERQKQYEQLARAPKETCGQH